MRNRLKSKLGIKLELELVNSIGEKIGQSYVSQLIDVEGEHNLVIAAPIHESRLMLITPGTRIRAVFLDEKQGLLSFLGTIIFREKKESIISLHVKTDGIFEKIQRRNYFRLDCLLNVTFFPYKSEPSADTAENPPDGLPQKALTRNISGSGTCIVAEEAFPKGTNIDLSIWLSDDIQIKATAKVIRCTKIEGIRDKKYELGLYFTNLDQKNQEALVKYIFNQQRVLLKNNMPDK